MNPRRWLEVWCNIHMHRQPNPHSVWGFLVRNHGATSKLFHCYSKTHLSIHMFGPHACSGCLRGLATCVIIGELAHLQGRMDGHHVTAWFLALSFSFDFLRFLLEFSFSVALWSGNRRRCPLLCFHSGLASPSPFLDLAISILDQTPIFFSLGIFLFY